MPEEATIEQAPPAPAPAESGPKTFDSVADAVAELERREQARKEARKAAKEAEKAKAEAPADDDADEPENPRRVKQAKAEEAEEAEEDDSDDDSEDEDLEASDDDEDSEDDAEEATDEEDEDEPPKKVVKLDGKEIEIPKGTPRALVDTVSKLAEDLKSDYTKKTQEVAQGRQALAERTQAAEALMAQVQRAQQAVVAMAQQYVGNPPPLELAQQDPGSYTVQKALYEQRIAQLQALSGQTQQMTAHQQQLMQQQQQEQLAEEARKVIELIPELAKPEGRKSFLSAAVQAATASGFTEQEVAEVSDHRMLHLLHRLVKAERALSAREQAGKSVKAKLANVPPKTLKPGASSQGQAGKSERIARAKAEFAKSSRSMRDVQRYLAATGN